MNRRSSMLGPALLIAALLVLTACTSPGISSPSFGAPIVTPDANTVVPPPIVTDKDVTITFELGNPAEEGQPIPLTVTISSRVALSDAQASLTVQGPVFDRRDPPRSLGDLTSDDPKQITTTLELPRDAQYFIKLHLFTPEGFHMSDSRNVWVGNTDVAVNPTPAYGPGTPAPAAQDKSVPTAGPTATP